MPKIRRVQIRNFRAIKCLDWLPNPGINCVIGSGDSGKSTVLNAIDLCLGARGNLEITDADFNRLDVDTPIEIEVTLGALDDALKILDSYGLYVGGFDPDSGQLIDEPEAELETVLTIKLIVEADLEARWELVSERASSQGKSRNLSWADRIRLAPTRLGAIGQHHLGWRRGSVLTRISEERPDASAALAQAARKARSSFGEEAKDQLGETLETVATVAKRLGVPIGDEVRALLDAHAVSFGGGTISLHDEVGVPLRGLGLGSTRLLIAGLQSQAGKAASAVLIDEVEHGLEPQRIMRLLDELGAKNEEHPHQVFMTTHSPVAVRELSGDQLYILRPTAGQHELKLIGSANEVQSTIRMHPDALLAPSILVCEGASEVGLIRGLDQFRVSKDKRSITALGVALVDGGGTAMLDRALSFQSLGYRTAILKDSDVEGDSNAEQQLRNNGGEIFAWPESRALEDELFQSMTDSAVCKLVDLAVELKGESLVNEQIKSASNNDLDLSALSVQITPELRKVLGKAARSKSRPNGWFKTVGAMENAARNVIGPDLDGADQGLKDIIDRVFAWPADVE